MQLLAPVAQIQQDLGTCLGRVTAPQPLGPSGPIAQGHLMTIEIQGVDLILSLVLKMNKHEVPSYYGSRCEQYHKGITKWIDNLLEESNMPADNKPVRIHCIAGSLSARLVFETRAKCQDFVARYKDGGILYEFDSPFCNAKTIISPRDRKAICTLVEGSGRSSQNSLP